MFIIVLYIFKNIIYIIYSNIFQIKIIYNVCKFVNLNISLGNPFSLLEFKYL